jgi:hypothetical protein
MAAIMARLNTLEERYKNNELWQRKPGDEGIDYNTMLKARGFEIVEGNDGSTTYVPPSSPKHSKNKK